ncbi:pyrimidine reductase family protein [Lysinimonas soli]|uniref:Pyrimidine reductase family protein n=1 Tax=Lysinimonas soli TaxID=1074233 RepID=A0ABW0NME8_9MICO
MSDRIDRLWPDAAEDLSDEEVLAGLGPGVHVNFVSSIDGAATRDARSGGLSSDADRRHFELLRRSCDVVLVGAGTVRVEGYGAMRVSPASARWRLENGLFEHPVLAMVTERLDLDPASSLFTDAPRRPIVITSSSAPGRDAFSRAADLVVAGEERVDLGLALSALRDRGLTRVLCEGGPSLFGSMLEADLVDDLFLTISPTLEAGNAVRIAHGPSAASRSMELVHVLRSGDELLLRYRRRG